MYTGGSLPLTPMCDPKSAIHSVVLTLRRYSELEAVSPSPAHWTCSLSSISSAASYLLSALPLVNQFVCHNCHHTQCEKQIPYNSLQGPLSSAPHYFSCCSPVHLTLAPVFHRHPKPQGLCAVTVHEKSPLRSKYDPIPLLLLHAYSQSINLGRLSLPI